MTNILKHGDPHDCVFPSLLTVGEEVKAGLCRRALISKIRLGHKAVSAFLEQRLPKELCSVLAFLIGRDVS